MRFVIVALAVAVGACASGPRAPEPSPLAVELPRPIFGPDETHSEIPFAAQTGERERCIDRELAARNLNEYGDPAGTKYDPDSPVLALTDRSHRYRYVLQKRKDIGVACTRAPHDPR